MHNYFFLLCFVAIFSGCTNIGTTTTYSRSLTKSKSESERIFLTFDNTKNAHYHFILVSSNNNGYPQDLLKVRWTNPDKNNMQFNSLSSTIKFTVNHEKIITLYPIKEPIIVGYNLENKTSEEEAIYYISRDELQKLADAKMVDIELTGKYKVVMAKFNKWHTFKAFKDFLKNS